MTDDPYRILRTTFQDPTTFIEKDRPFPVSPSPFTISASKYESICAKAKCVLTALEKAAQTVLDTDRLWARFPELHAVEEYIRLPSTTPRIVDLARFDLAIVKDGGVRMMESNAGCPGALTTAGDLNAAFATTEDYLKDFGGRVIPQGIDSKFYFVDYLASLIPDGLPKHIAFLSSRHRPLATDLWRLTDLAHERGYIGIRCDIQDLAYDGTRVTLHGIPIHAAFLKFHEGAISGNQVDQGMYGPDDGPEQPFLQALRDGAIPVVNSFISRLLVASKRLLAMLQEHEVQSVLTDEQRTAVHELVIPTFSLDPAGSQEFGGADRFIREKDQWVIKKVLETRGRGVYVGKYHTDEDWRDLITSSLDLDICVVQSFVELDVQEIHDPVSVSVSLSSASASAGTTTSGCFKAYTDIGLYMLGGEAVGFLCRGSRDPVVNVGKSGALRPTYVIKEGL